MGEHKVNIGVVGSPELKKALELQARHEGRSTSNLCERLLQWAFDQARAAGDSQKLMRWRAAPPADELELSLAADRAVLDSAPPKRKRK